VNFAVAFFSRLQFDKIKTASAGEISLWEVSPALLPFYFILIIQ